MHLRSAISRMAAALPLAALAAVGITALYPGGAGAVSARAAPVGSARYVPGVVLVGYRTVSVEPAADGARRAVAEAVRVRVVRVPHGATLAGEIRRLRARRGVAYAVPDYLAHIAQGSTPAWFPNDPGTAHVAQGWEKKQWNFLPTIGVNAPEAWANLFVEHHPGGRGVIIAVLDTGIAYRNWHQFVRSPDFAGTRFVHPYDFVSNNRYPLDREGHGTFVGGTIAEATNNGFGLTGIAYGASVMPVRVLDGNGWGDAATIAKGIRYAATHGAQVINLSLEFDPSVTAGDIPGIISAIRFAHQRGAVVVAASGNEGLMQLAYPARARDVISVGATTADRCLADYSNGGATLDLVAPGGGEDQAIPSDPDCQPARQNLPDIYQMTFGNPYNPRQFGYPSGWYGTSMAAPHVAAVAALVIASGVIGRHPSPDQVLARLEATAQPLGGSKPNSNYGYGLVDAGAATAPAAAGG